MSTNRIGFVVAGGVVVLVVIFAVVLFNTQVASDSTAPLVNSLSSHTIKVYRSPT